MTALRVRTSPRWRPALAACLSALALGALAWAAETPPQAERLRSLRNLGYASLDRGDAEAALRAAAQMLQLAPGHRDALLLEERAHQARLANQPAGLPPLSHPPTSLLSEIAREKRPPGSPDAAPALPSNLSLRAPRLDQPIAIEFIETPLPDALRRLSAVAGIPIRLAEDVKEPPTVTLPRANMPLQAVLRWLSRLTRLHYAFRQGAIVFSARPDAAAEIVRETYDLRDLATPPQGRVPTGASLDTLAEGWARYIRTTIAPGTWDDEATVLQERNPNSIAYRGGRLVVVHNPDVQQQVADLLDMFRRDRTLQVYILCRFLLLSQASSSALGLEFAFDSLRDPQNPNGPSRTLFSIVHNTGVSGSARFTDLDDTGGLSLTTRILDEISLSVFLRAVAKQRQSSFISAPRITCFNTQRAVFQWLTNRNYVRRVTGDDAPEIGNIPDGMLLDVQPFVSADRRYITIVLQPRLRTLVSLVDYHFLTRTLLTESANVNVLTPYEVLIQIPTTTLRSIGTTVSVPNGGTLLVGGLTEIEEFHGQASMPFAQNVPILRYILRRTDDLQGRRSLAVLVTAQTVPDILAE